MLIRVFTGLLIVFGYTSAVAFFKPYDKFNVDVAAGMTQNALVLIFVAVGVQLARPSFVLPVCQLLCT